MKKNLFLILALSLFAITSNAQSLPQQATDIAPMVVGEVVPDVTLTNTEGDNVTLKSLMGAKPTIVVFYRGVWCFNCTNNFKAEFVPNLATIEQMGYNLICVSPDTPANLKKTAADAGMAEKYFYGDPKGNLAKAMGVAFLATGRAVDLTKGSSEGLNTDPYLPAPAFYVLNPEGEVLFADIRPNAIPAAKRITWNLMGAVLPVLK